MPLPLKLCSAIFLLLLYSGSVTAADLFQLTVNGQTRSYSSVDELPDFNTIKQQFSVSDWDNDLIEFSLNYRGIDLKAVYPAGSNKVTFNMPSLNKNWSYEGASRQGSWTQLTDALVQESDLVNDLLALMVQYTPNDPVAGNPSSLMDNLVRLDFSAALVDLPFGKALQVGDTGVESLSMSDTEGIAVDEFDSSGSSVSPEVVSSEENKESSTETSERENKISIGLGFSSYDQGDSKVNTTTIPFSYSWNFEGESKSSLTLRVPISQLDVDGNTGIAFGLGLNYRQNLTPNWQISPNLNYGMAASESLGSGGALASYSLLCSREAAKMMLEQGKGSIVNVASIMGLIGGGVYPNPAYQASKGGVVNLTRSLALDWASRGIRVNAVAPAFVRTPLTQSLLAEDGMEEKLLVRTPLGRIVETYEVADAIRFLASDAAAMITGHTLPVDGGWVAQ